MKDLIKRGQALRVSEMDSEIYLALNCLPSVEAIPVEWLRDFMKRDDVPVEVKKGAMEAFKIWKEEDEA